MGNRYTTVIAKVTAAKHTRARPPVLELRLDTGRRPRMLKILWSPRAVQVLERRVAGSGQGLCFLPIVRPRKPKAGRGRRGIRPAEPPCQKPPRFRALNYQEQRRGMG